MNGPLPEALARVLGKVIAEQKRQGNLEIERIAAEARASIAEARSERAAIVAELRTENAALRAELAASTRALADAQVERIDAALANVKDGAPGRDADPDAIAEAVLARIPPPQSGKDADPQEVAALVLAQLPPPPPGRDGKDGVDGKGADPEFIVKVVDEAVADAIAALPVPKDGRDGVDGKDGAPGADGAPGRDGVDGKPGADGAPGRDAADIASAFRTHEGKCILTLTDGRLVDLGIIQGKDGAPGRDGSPGKDGRDGFGFDDLEFEQTGPRSGVLRFMRGEHVKEFSLQLPGHLYRGVWTEGQEYDLGDTVSHGGSLWHANEATKDRPGNGSAAWTMCVKHGRDGRDGAPGAKGEKGDPGRPGRDLTLLTGGG
jgi:integrin beta 3